jgi:hypothetical protein
MKNLTSSELAITQKALKAMINKELKRPMIDFEELEVMVAAMGKIDHNRRLAWNDEKFGDYEEMAAHMLKAEQDEFGPDDIPF